MPVNPVLYSGLTGATSYLPVIGDNQLKFIFWQASQRSNALKRIYGLVYQKTLGEGASFTVGLYRNEVTDPKLPREVAVKTLKLTPALTRDPLNEDVNLYCLLLELEILLHEPLSRHPNIINVLGMDWNSSIYGSPIPLLIIEYSALGSLTGFLRSHPGLSITIKGRLCLNIAEGLKMIHNCGIVHGDVKLDNVLIFEDENGDFVAKITDFGCSITGFEPEERGIYRGTRSYWAPELKETEKSTLPDLQRCDVYSLGLCVLEILNDGERSNGKSENFEELAHIRNETPLERLTISQQQGDRMIGENHAERAQKTMTLVHDGAMTVLRHLLCGMLQPNPVLRLAMKEVVDLLHNTFVAEHRDLKTEIPPVPFRRTPMGVWNVSAPNNKIPRDAQQQSVADLQSSYPSLEKMNRGRALLLLSDCYAHGYGVPVQFEEALKHLELAASSGLVSAEAILPRVTRAIAYSSKPSKSISPSISEPAMAALSSPELNLIERMLTNVPNNEYYMRRLRLGTKPTLESLADSKFSILGNNDREYILDFSNCMETAKILETRATISPTMILKAENDSSVTFNFYFLQFIVAAGFLDLLKLLKLSPSTLNTVIPQQDVLVLNAGSLILAAAGYGQIAVLRYLVHSGVSAAAHRGEMGPASTLNGLHYLFMFEDEDVEEAAQILIEGGSDPNLTSNIAFPLTSFSPDFPLEISGPPLDVAISAGDIRAVRILLQLGADPLLSSGPTVGKQGHTCLGLAIALHNYMIVETILEHLCKIQKKPIPTVTTSASRMNPLVYISGIVIGGKGLFWRWMLHGSNYKEACSRTIATCLKYGMSTDSCHDGELANGITPVHMAAHMNPCQNYVLEALLESGANVNCRDVLGQTPLCFTESGVWDPKDNEKTTMLLAQYGANVNIKDAKGRTPAHHHADQNSYLSLKYIIKQGAFLDARDVDGVTPLYRAIRNGAYEATKVLLESGANGCEVFRSSQAPATSEGRKPRLRDIFPAKGKERSQEKPCQTALHAVASALGPSYQPEIMRLLLHGYGDYFKKPDILNRLDQNGYTALQWAASRSLQAARELVLAGADLEIRDPTSKTSGTPLAPATQAGRLDIVEFLLENGANVFCRGPPEQKLYSFLNEVVYCMGSRPEQRGQFRPLLKMTEKWIDKFNLLKVRDFAGRTILQYAIFSGEVEAVKAFLDIGASQGDLVLSGWDLPANAWSWRDEHLWHASQWFGGLNILDYAMKLQARSPADKTAWHNFASHKVADSDMTTIIDILEGLGLSSKYHDKRSFSSQASGFFRKWIPVPRAFVGGRDG